MKMFFSNFAESQKKDTRHWQNVAECPTPRTRQLVTVTDVVTSTGRGNGVTVVVTVVCGARDIVCRVFTVRHSAKR